MDTLLFVLLAWILALECLTSLTVRRTRTLIVRAASPASIPEESQRWSQANGLDRSEVEEILAACQYERGSADQEDVASPPSASTESPLRLIPCYRTIALHQTQLAAALHQSYAASSAACRIRSA